jgi:hypothetical protein
MNVKFTKTQTATGQVQYMHETDSHRFYVRRDLDNKGIWMAEVWTLRSVGIIDLVKVTDRQVRTLIGWTRAEAYALVQQYIDTYLKH